ncbi:hypothetical protein VRB67_21960 [Pseudomonas trivialis]
MELREDVMLNQFDRYELAALDIQDFLLYDQPIKSITLADVVISPENRPLFD